ncbi:MAG: nuclear transport factor 2 family protein [Actinomycetes bacterium]
MKALEVLEKALELLEHKDLDGFLVLLSDDCVIMKDSGEVMARGTAELHKFYLPIFGSQAALKIEIGDQFSTGSVIAMREINHNMSIDGELKDFDTVWIYKVVNDKITYMHVFSPDADTDKALTSLA